MIFASIGRGDWRAGKKSIDKSGIGTIPVNRHHIGNKKTVLRICRWRRNCVEYGEKSRSVAEWMWVRCVCIAGESNLFHL